MLGVSGVAQWGLGGDSDPLHVRFAWEHREIYRTGIGYEYRGGGKISVKLSFQSLGAGLWDASFLQGGSGSSCGCVTYLGHKTDLFNSVHPPTLWREQSR